MGWLIGPTIVAALCSVIIVYVYNHILDGVHGILVSVGRICLFAGVWASITVAALLRSFDESTRWFRRTGGKEVGEKPKSLPKLKRFW